jgi:hypothetical protein
MSLLTSSLKQYVDDLVKIHIVNLKDILYKDRLLVDNILNKEIPDLWDAIHNLLDVLFPAFKQEILDLLNQFKDQINERLDTTEKNLQTAIDNMERVPVGMIGAFWGTTAPADYLLCNGGTFSRTTYPKLYNFLGSTTLPDLRGCFLRGLGGEANGFRSRQADAGRKLQASTSALGHFQTLWCITGDGSAPPQSYYDNAVSGCFTLTNNRSGGLGPLGQHRVHFADIELRLSNINLWSTGNMANEFRPINYAISYCIKAV